MTAAEHAGQANRGMPTMDGATIMLAMWAGHLIFHALTAIPVHALAAR